MALAGAGNPVGGSNPAGTGGTLNYIGDHAYMYTGFSTVTNIKATIASFSTGELYVVGSFQPQYDTNTATNNYGFEILLNGEKIGSTQITSATDYSPYEELEILIPPYSKIEITAQNKTGSDPNDVGAIIIGRVYA
jgi:hypothetical protein